MTSISKTPFKFLLSTTSNSECKKNNSNQSTQLNNIKKASSKYVKFNNLVYEQIELNLKLIQDEHKSTNSYGFIIAGYCPSHVETVIENTISYNAGLKKGDLIIKINDVSCCRARIKSILSLIKNNQNDSLKLTIYRRLVDSQKAYRLAKRVNMTKNLSIDPKSGKSSFNHKSKNIKLISKLLRPSLWLSCAQPSNTTMSSTFIYNATQNFEDKDETVQNSKCLSISESHTEYVLCSKDCCKFQNNKLTESTEKILKSVSAVDTGYETLSRYGDSTERIVRSSKPQNDDFDLTIDTVTNTINSYSECDLTIEPVAKTVRFIQEDKRNVYNDQHKEVRTKLIGDLIELEANFVSYLSLAVSTFSRPLRGFFIKQQDYFVLFQNIEKILVISENFLRSMDKWSAYDLYIKIGQLYTQKMSLFRDAFTIYVNGYQNAKSLLNELKSHSKQFRLFLNEVQSANLTLSNLIDLPVVHMQKTLEIFKQIRKFTFESKRNPSEAPHIDSVIFEFRKILNQLNENMSEINQVYYNHDNYYEDDMTEEYYTEEEDSTSFFMETSDLSSIDENENTTMIDYSTKYDSYCSDTMSSGQSTVSSL